MLATELETIIEEALEQHERIDAAALLYDRDEIGVIADDGSYFVVSIARHPAGDIPR